jgi:uncharacterized protein (DUF488 family)
MESETNEKPSRATNNSATRVIKKGMITSRANQPGIFERAKLIRVFKRNNQRMTRIWTIGHSTRTIEEFIEALQANGIKLVADVRLLPGSRRYPQFNREMLAKSLIGAGIGYEHFPELGGRRKPRKNSRNTAWRNDAFRGYADHMETPEFVAGIACLEQATERRGAAAIMCAEAVWWKCHRSLIADYLKAQGTEVIHIMDANKTELHPFTSAARVVNGTLDYSGEERELSIQGL